MKNSFIATLLIFVVSCGSSKRNYRNHFSFLDHLDKLHAAMPVESAYEIFGEPRHEWGTGNETHLNYYSHDYNMPPEGEIGHALYLTFVNNELRRAVLHKSIDDYQYPEKVLVNDQRALSLDAGLTHEEIDHSEELMRVDKLYRSGKISRQEMIKRATAINKKYFSVE